MTDKEKDKIDILANRKIKTSLYKYITRTCVDFGIFLENSNLYYDNSEEVFRTLSDDRKYTKVQMFHKYITSKEDEHTRSKQDSFSRL
jgi:hypothetical protein